MTPARHSIALATLLLASNGTQAALVNAGNGLVNDTVLDITWVANAALSGEQSWEDLTQWAEGLVYAGYDDWRLASLSVASDAPTMSTIDCTTVTEEDCRDNELGYMYMYYLPGNYGETKTGGQTVGNVILTGIQDVYWSATEFAPTFLDYAWGFSYGNVGGFDPGRRISAPMATPRYGWAVRDGQVATAPLPSTPLLIALGFTGMLLFHSLRRRIFAHTSRECGPGSITVTFNQ
jgi:hypothetical protein